jgi:predicted ATPase
MVAADQRAAVITLARSEPYLDTAPPEAPEPPLRVPERPPTNLIAPLTRLIGRKQDLAAVRNALLRSEARLLTLIGPPGIGKTRLSIAVAHDIQAAFADGAYFVALAPLGDPALVLATIAQMLEVRETAGQPLLETLKRVLHARRLLLLLDNFEHLLDAAPLVVELLEACPGLKALVTSRAALHVRGERLYAVPPLLLPDLTHLPATVRLARNPAIALFVERAQAVMPDFRLTEQNAPAVAAICARLEGLPLALELAATRIKLLSPETLLARLEQRLSLLTDGARDLPPRHRTLRAAIEWSYELLDVGVQTLFCRLGVFVGGCTLDAATAVSNTTNDVLVDVTGGIASLLDKSLLQQVEGMDGEARFTMLETIREYALERLEQSGEAEAVRQRHAEYCLALAEIAEPHLQQHDQLSWLDRLEREHDNLRAALRWVLDGDAGEIGLRLAAALAEFWFIRSYRSEARGWFEAVLAHPNAAAPTPVRAKVLLAASSAIGSRTAIPALAEESLAISRTLGDTACGGTLRGKPGALPCARGRNGPRRCPARPGASDVQTG